MAVMKRKKTCIHLLMNFQGRTRCHLVRRGGGGCRCYFCLGEVQYRRFDLPTISIMLINVPPISNQFTDKSRLSDTNTVLSTSFAKVGQPPRFASDSTSLPGHSLEAREGKGTLKINNRHTKCYRPRHIVWEDV